MSKYVFDKQKWQNLTIFEQMGNIAKTPRSPARPRAICWYGGRIVGGLLYVGCYSGAEGAIIKTPHQYLTL